MLSEMSEKISWGSYDLPRLAAVINDILDLPAVVYHAESGTIFAI
jgi:hypothetical protein